MTLSDDQIRRLLHVAESTEEDRYAPVGSIGEGGMGSVTAVWDGRLLREVAHKQLRADAHPGLVERFLREARITAQLEHPNIVAVYDVDDDDELPSFTMRRIRGASLAESLDRAELGTLADRLDVFRKVCEAVAYAHDCGVLHRDLKPANVMVGRFGEVLVVDWGLAKVAGEPDPTEIGIEVVGGAGATRVGTVSGTPQFMAPEQARGEPATEATDVFGLGRVLACLVAGQPVPPATVPGPWELAAIISRATAPAAGDRYPSVLALLDDVRAFQERRPLPSLRYSWVRRIIKGLERNRRVAIGSGATGLLAGIVLAVAVSTQAERNAAVLREARDDAVAANVRAQRELGSAHLALSWSAAGRRDGAEAREHIREAGRIRGTEDAEVALAAAWLDWRFPRPLRILPVSMDGPPRFGPEGRFAYSGDEEFAIQMVDGSERVLGSGRLLDWVGDHLVVWNAGLEVYSTEGSLLWRVPYDGRGWPRVRIAGDAIAFGVDGVGASVWEVATGELRYRDPVLEDVLSLADNGHLMLGAPIDVRMHRTPPALLIHRDGELVRELPGLLNTVLTPSGEWVAMTDGRVAALESVAGDQRREVEFPGVNRAFVAGDRVAFASGPEVRVFGMEGPIDQVVLPYSPENISPDGERAAYNLDGEHLLEWTLVPPPSASTPAGAVTDIALSPDGELVAVTEWEGHLLVLDAESRMVLSDTLVDPDGLRSAEWHPDGTRVLVGGRSGRAVEVDVASGRRLWESARRDAIAMDAHYAGDDVRVGWEDGAITDRHDTQLLAAGEVDLWAFTASEPWAISGRDDAEPSLVVPGGHVKTPDTSAYGVDELDGRLAVGTGVAVFIAERGASEWAELAPSAPVVDVAFLTPHVVLSATYDGALGVWVEEEDGWRASEPLPLDVSVLSTIEVAGDAIWVGADEGEVLDLHLNDGPTLALREALRRGLTTWLDEQELEGLDAVRRDAVLGRVDAAVAGLGELSGPTAAIWRAHLERTPRP